jgi:hypothetical protein
MNSLMNTLEELYQTNNIRSAILVCDTIPNAIKILQKFEEHDHSAVLFRMKEDADDERAYEGYIHRLRQFLNCEHRILIITYEDWFHFRDDLEPFICKHNLLILQDIEGQTQRLIMDWIADARRRGFLETDLPYFVHVQH